MSYIGRGTDKISNIEKLDTITFDGSSSYTLQKNSVNFTPNSANSLQVSIDGVVQAGNFTVSGSTIDFGVAIPSTSTNDFIFHYGTGLVTTVADGAITTAKLGDAAVTTAKIADANVTSAKMFSGFANGITMADQWRLSADTNTGTDAVVSTNWERNDNAAYGSLGTGLTESSGIFSFPETGIYLIQFTAAIAQDGSDNSSNVVCEATINNSSYVSQAVIVAQNQGNSTYGISQVFILDVTDISNVKFRFSTSSFAGTSELKGSTSQNNTSVTCIRLGDT